MAFYSVNYADFLSLLGISPQNQIMLPFFLRKFSFFALWASYRCSTLAVEQAAKFLRKAIGRMVGERRAEDRGQKTEDRRHRTEDRGWRTEGRGGGAVKIFLWGFFAESFFCLFLQLYRLYRHQQPKFHHPFRCFYRLLIAFFIGLLYNGVSPRPSKEYLKEKMEVRVPSTPFSLFWATFFI
jgi:hypothetical protein